MIVIKELTDLEKELKELDQEIDWYIEMNYDLKKSITNHQLQIKELNINIDDINNRILERNKFINDNNNKLDKLSQKRKNLIKRINNLNERSEKNE